MGLGIVTNVAQGVRAASAPQNGARGPTEAGSLPKLLDDDAAAAVIHSDRGDEESGVRQNAVDTSAATPGQILREFTTSFTEGLAKYLRLSQEVADGRFSPKTLRDQIEASAKSVDEPGTVAGQNRALAFLNSDEPESASRGATGTRALAWLSGKSEQALSSQQNVEPGRVLILLRDMIRGAKPDRQETVTLAEDADLAQEPENE